MEKQKSITKCRGLTLIELLVTMTLLAIVASLAAPSFSGLVRTNTLTGNSTQLVRAINVAKSEAVTRNERILMCARSGNNCINDGHWENGWIIFADQNQNASIDNGEIIRVFDPLKGGHTLRTAQNLDRIAFLSRGNIETGFGGFPAGGLTLRLCHPSADSSNLTTHSRGIEINNLGRVILSEGATSCP